MLTSFQSIYSLALYSSFSSFVSSPEHLSGITNVNTRPSLSCLRSQPSKSRHSILWFSRREIRHCSPGVIRHTNERIWTRPQKHPPFTLFYVERQTKCISALHTITKLFVYQQKPTRAVGVHRRPADRVAKACGFPYSPSDTPAHEVELLSQTNSGGGADTQFAHEPVKDMPQQ